MNANIIKKKIIQLTKINYKKKNINQHIKNSFKKDNYKKIENKNLIFFYKKKNKKKTILFVAHLDVARSEKARPPVLKKNRIYAAGALDDLAGCSMLIALKNYVSKNSLDTNVEFLFLKKEETLDVVLKKKIVSKNKNIIFIDGTSSDRIITSSYYWKIFDIKLLNQIDTTSFSNIHKVDYFIHKIENSIKAINKKLKKVCKVYHLDISDKKDFIETIYFPKKIRVYCRSKNSFNLYMVKKTIRDVLKKNKIKFNVKLLKEQDGFRYEKNNVLLKKFKKILNKNRNKYYLSWGGYAPMKAFRTKNIFLYGPGHGKYPHSSKEFYDLKDGNLVLKNLIDLIDSF